MNSEQLKRWRQRQKLTQQEAADLIGCSRRAIQNYESGQPIPKHIALAISALRAKLRPYG